MNVSILSHSTAFPDFLDSFIVSFT